MADNQQNQNHKSYNNYNNYQPKQAGFDPFDPVKTPWKTAGYGLIWLVIIGPFVLGMMGIYNPKDIFSVLGVSARRGATAAIEESKPAAEVICSQRFGEGNCQRDNLRLPVQTNGRQDTRQGN